VSQFVIHFELLEQIQVRASQSVPQMSTDDK
jgi:hypothetical protein